MKTVILELHKQQNNLREVAILEILEESKKHGESPLKINAILRGLGDSQLFALYVDLFGYAVGEKAAK